MSELRKFTFSINLSKATLHFIGHSTYKTNTAMEAWIYYYSPIQGAVLATIDSV